MPTGLLPRETRCPRCAFVATAATSCIRNDSVRTGDYAVCANCAALHVFSDGLHLRPPTDAELLEFHVLHAANMPAAVKVPQPVNPERFRAMLAVAAERVTALLTPFTLCLFGLIH